MNSTNGRAQRVVDFYVFCANHHFKHTPLRTSPPPRTPPPEKPPVVLNLPACTQRACVCDQQVVERREALEKWFQKIAQDTAVTNSIEFRDFLLNQQDEVKLCCEEVDVTVRGSVFPPCSMRVALCVQALSLS
jgi:hypothetical protein